MTEIIHPADLSLQDVQAWRAMQASEPAFASPLLGPDFARIVGEARDDARVAVWREGGRATAFLAHHRRPSGFGRPIGGPFSDYHALVGAPGAASESGRLLSAAGLNALRVAGLVDPTGVFAAAPTTAREAFRIDLDAGPLPHLAGANRRKNARRYRLRLERDVGPLQLIADTDADAFAQLVAWKRAQLARSGLHDFMHPPWAQALMHRLFETRGAPFAGLMLSLYAGSRLVAGHFGVRLGDHYHPWIGAMDPDLHAYAPGFLHQWAAVEAMPSVGLRIYDLGPGSAHWKTAFANASTTVASGLVTTATLGGRIAGASEGVWALPPLARAGVARRLRGRLDQIAAMELTTAGRVRGLVHAAAGFERRQAAHRRLDGLDAQDAAGARP